MDIPTDPFVTQPATADHFIETSDGLNPQGPESFPMGSEAEAVSSAVESISPESVTAIDPLTFATCEIGAISSMAVLDAPPVVDVQTLPLPGEAGVADQVNEATVGNPGLADGESPDQVLVNETGGEGMIASTGRPTFIAWSTMNPGLASGEPAPDPLADHPTGEPVTDAVAADPGTTATVAIDESQLGSIDQAGDHDWFGVSLIAGQTYRVTVLTESLDDPTLSLRDETGAELLFSDDANGLQPEIVFTAESTGRHLLDVGGYDDSVGDYRVSITLLPEGMPPATGDNPGDGLEGPAASTGSGDEAVDGVAGATGELGAPTGVWNRGVFLTLGSDPLTRPFSPLPFMRGFSAAAPAVTVDSPNTSGIITAAPVVPPSGSDPITGSPTVVQPIMNEHPTTPMVRLRLPASGLPTTPPPGGSATPMGIPFHFVEEAGAILAAPRREESGQTVESTSRPATTEAPPTPTSTFALLAPVAGFGSVRDPLLMGWGIDGLLPPLIADLVPGLFRI